MQKETMERDVIRKSRRASFNHVDVYNFAVN